MEAYVVVAALAIVIGLILMRPMGLALAWATKTTVPGIVWFLISWLALIISSIWLAKWVFHITKC